MDAADAELIALRVLSLKRLSGVALPESPLRQRVVFSLQRLAAFQNLRLSLGLDLTYTSEHHT